MNQKVNPLIAMIPLASLVALIIVVVNLFPDDALAGAYFGDKLSPIPKT